MPVARISPASQTTELAHSSTSVRQARSLLASALSERDVIGGAADDAILILSELVTNALRHARALSSGTIRVSWDLSGDGQLRIEVTDGGGTTRPTPKPYSMSVSAQAGRGLEIVDRLADRWGSQREEGGDEYTVWAELAVRARHASRRARDRDQDRDREFDRGSGQSGSATATVTALPTASPQVRDRRPHGPTTTRPDGIPLAAQRSASSVVRLLPPYPSTSC